MRVFLTGATGFIGSRIVLELLAAGHQVIGLARSDAGAQSLTAIGAQVHRGTLEDPDSLYAGANAADAVIHTAFDHDFSQFSANCEKDRLAIDSLGAALKGSKRPLLITSGTGMGDNHDGRPATEAVFDAHNPNPRRASELAGQVWLDAGVDVRVIRLPQVHDRVKQGVVSLYVEVSRQKGVAAYIGEGANRWPAGHVQDVAKLYVLALDKGKCGARYHAVAEEGIPVCDIATVIGARLGVPVASLSAEEAPAHFGWLAMFAEHDLSASSIWTRQQLGWEPTAPGLIDDLQSMHYS